MRILGPILSLFVALGVSATSRADVVFDEGNGGDLSSNASSPTQLNLRAGFNQIRGIVGGAGFDFRDLVNFTIGADQQLVATTLDRYADALGNPASNFRFFGGSNGESGPFLGLARAGENQVGDNLQALAGVGPLGPGDYSFSIREFTPFQRYNVTLKVDDPSIIYDESVQGGLSNDLNAPNLLDLQLGDNRILGEVGGFDPRDYLSFELAPGQRLEAVILEDYLPTATNGNQATRFWIYDGAGSSRQVLDTFLAGEDEVGVNLLDSTGLGPLGGSDGGVFSLNLRELIAGQRYQVNLVVVPEPSHLAFVGITGIGFVAAWQRKRRS